MQQIKEFFFMTELLHGKFILEVLEDEEFISVLGFNF